MIRFSALLPKKAIRRNTLWNILGQGFPLVLAVFMIPPLIRGMGTDRFGALTLVWTILTYFTLFDMGLGRALTQLLATGTRENKREESELVWMTSALLLLLGAAAAVVLWATAPLIAARLLKLHGPLAAEMTTALRALGLALPVLIHSLALRGILEAKRRFDLSNLIRIPLGVFTYGAPLLVLPFSHSLVAIVSVLLAGRVAAWLWNLWMVFRILPHLSGVPEWKPGRLRELLRFGGWVTASSIVTPFTDNMDRFFITSVMTISWVAYYTTPYELVSKLWILSAGIGGVIFPEFAARFHRSPGEARVLYFRGLNYMLAALFPCVLVATAYAREGLGIWLNPQFAAVSGPVFQWLALAMLIGAFRMVPFTFLLGIGRPHIVLLNDLVELPIHVAILYFLLKFDGLRGAAIAYCLRMMIGFLAFLFFSGSILEFGARAYAKVLLPLAGAMAVILAFHLRMPPAVKLPLVLAALAAHAAYVWAFVLQSQDKDAVLRKLGRPAPG